MKPLYRALINAIIYVIVMIAVRFLLHKEIEWLVIGAVAVFGFVFNYIIISIIDYASKH